MFQVALPLLTVAANVAAAEELGERRALLISMSDYGYDDPQTGWKDLNAHNDSAWLTEALVSRGFAADHIARIADKDATRDGILDALRALENRTQAGDHLVVHYSGHGQQLRDDDGDEVDGYDESLVPYGAPMAQDGYDGGKHLRDDDLAKSIKALRLKAGPGGSVAILLDSCHSGTATRGRIERGGAEPLGEPATISGAVARGADFAAPDSDPALAPSVVLSAARSKQLAREVTRGDGSPGGAFTTALVQTLREPRPLLTWTDVYERVRAKMSQTAKGQVPQIEGQSDTVLFDGTQVERGAWFTVDRVRGDEIRLAVGAIDGLLPGSVIELHQATATEPGKDTLVHKSTVTTATGSTATIAKGKLELPDSEVIGLRAFVTSWAPLPAELLRVMIAQPDKAVAKRWKSVLAEQPLVVLVKSEPDVVLDHEAQLEGLTALAHAKLVGQLEMGGAKHRAEFALVPREGGDCERPGTAAGGTEGLELSNGQMFQVAVTNTGTLPSFLTVIHIGEDGTAMQLFPDKISIPEELQAGRSFTLPLCLDATTGTDRLKLFATRHPVDLGPVLGHTPATRSADPMQLLLNEASRGTRAGRSTATLDDGFTADLVWTTIP